MPYKTPNTPPTPKSLLYMNPRLLYGPEVYNKQNSKILVLHPLTILLGVIMPFNDPDTPPLRLLNMKLRTNIPRHGSPFTDTILAFNREQNYFSARLRFLATKLQGHYLLNPLPLLGQQSEVYLVILELTYILKILGTSPTVPLYPLYPILILLMHGSRTSLVLEIPTLPNDLLPNLSKEFTIPNLL